MNDLTERNDGIRGKVSEVERQLRDRVLEACCEEQMAKSSRQEARAMEEERARQQRVQQGHGEERVEEENREEMREIVDRTTATSEEEKFARIGEEAFDWRYSQKTSKWASSNGKTTEERVARRLKDRWHSKGKAIEGRIGRR